jgi:glutamate 5-kinase
VGVIRVKGKFERGDVVSVLDENNSEIARGLTNYSAVELARILGCHSSEIESILGYTYNEEVIHRNNLVLL